MKLTCAAVQEAVYDMFNRCTEARSAGGIALQDVVDQTRVIPPGWWLDWQTDYYLPPGFQFSAAGKKAN